MADKFILGFPISEKTASSVMFQDGTDVGIGTDSPTYLLDMESTATGLTHNLKLNKTPITDDYAEIAFQLWSGAGTGLNTFGGSGTSRPGVVLRAVNENASTAAGAFVIGTFSGGADNTNLTEKFRISSDGNVGIGTTSPETALHAKQESATILVQDTDTGFSTTEAYIKFSGSDVSGNFRTNIEQSIGIKDNSLVFARAGSENMRITSAGVVQVRGDFAGTGQNPTIQLYNTDLSLGDNQIIGDIDFYQSDGSGAPAGGVGVVSKIRSINENVFKGEAALTFHTGTAVSLAERMRITSGGNVLFGTQGTPNGTSVLFGTQGTPNGTSVYGSAFITLSSDRSMLYQASSIATTINLQAFFNSNGLVGTISTNGSSTAYNTSSDYRLKEDLQDFNGLDMISNISVYDFKWKVDESRSYGVMAHELQEVLPQAVTGEKDAIEEYEITPAVLDEEGNVSEEAVMGTRDDTQGVDYSKIVPLLVKSIQELKAEIELLKAR